MTITCVGFLRSSTNVAGPKATNGGRPGDGAVERNGWLDVIRAFAASWVVIFHLNEVIPYTGSPYRAFAKLGWLGVPIFFVVSGFCIQLTASRSGSWREFLWRRAWRIWPPYLASVLVVLAVVAIRKAGTGVNDVVALPHGAGQWIMTTLLLTRPATSVAPLNWVYWTLTVELGFYATMAVAIASGWVRTTLLVVSLLAVLSPMSTIAEPFFLPYWPVFMLGAALFEWVASRRAGAVALATLAVSGTVLRQPVAVQVAAFSTAALMTGVLAQRLHIAPDSAWAMVGRWSYSLYLIHVPVGVYLLLRARSRGVLAHETLHIAYDAVVLAACIMFAGLMHRYIEVPAIRISHAPAATTIRALRRRFGVEAPRLPEVG